MNEFPARGSKADIMRSMMQNTETAKLIAEAINSPIGSTSRTKARKLFSIMSKLHSNDGAGGPGSMVGMVEMVPQQQLPNPAVETPKNMVIFHKIPKPKIQYGKRLRKSENWNILPDGAGGPGDGSIVNYLNSIGKDSSFGARSMLAAQKGISGYKGTAAQNTQLLGMLMKDSNPSMTVKSSTSKPVYGPAIQAQPRNFQTPLNSGNTVAPSGNSDISNLFKTIQGLPNQYTAAGQQPDIPNTQIVNQQYTVAQSRDTGDQPVFGPSYEPKINQQTIPGLSVTQPEGASGNRYGLTGVGTPGWFASTPEAGRKDTSPGKSTEQYLQEARAKEQATQSNTQITAPQNQQNQQNLNTTAGPLPSTDVNTNTLASTSPVLGQQFLSSLSSLVGKVGGECGVFGNDFLESIGDRRVFGDLYEDKIKMATPGAGPQPGALAIFKTRLPYGHVSVVQSVNPDGTLNVVESNWNGDGKIGTRVVDAKTVSGYYIPQNISNAMLASSAQNAVSQGLGATQFALNTLQSQVGSLKNLTDENREVIEDKYDIENLRLKDAQIRYDNANLPQEVINYVRGRDEALATIDKEIEKYTEDTLENVDLSNPINAAKANAQLNYLYTLRGRQNQTYIGYLKNAIDTHELELNRVTDLYKTALDAAEREITSTNNITATEYEWRLKGLSDMYTNIEQAPLKELEAQKLRAEITLTQQKAIEEALKAKEGVGFLKTFQAMQAANVGFNPDGTLIPGTNLTSLITTMQNLDPQYASSDVLAAYKHGVLNYLNSKEDKNSTTGKGITAEEKMKVAQESLKQIGDFMVANNNDQNAVAAGQSILEEILPSYTSVIAQKIDSAGVTDQLIESIKSYAPTGWFGSKKASPTYDVFLKNFQEKTGNALDESIARAVFATLEQAKAAESEGTDESGNRVDPSDAPSMALEALLNKQLTDGTRQPLSTEEFVLRIAQLVSVFMIEEALG